MSGFVEFAKAKAEDVTSAVLTEESKTEGRHKSSSQRKWENFSSLVQYATQLKLEKHKAAINSLDELVKLVKTIKK